MNFFQRLLGTADITRQIEKRLQEIQEKMLADILMLRSENNSLKLELEKKDVQISDLARKLRDSNEADLFLELKKIEKRILEGEKKSSIDLSSLQNLQLQQQAYNSMLQQMRRF